MNLERAGEFQGVGEGARCTLQMIQEEAGTDSWEGKPRAHWPGARK